MRSISAALLSSQYRSSNTAERRVAAANARIGVAQAAWFPSLTLSASTGYAGNSLSKWFSAPAFVWSLGASAAPWFERFAGTWNNFQGNSIYSAGGYYVWTKEFATRIDPLVAELAALRAELNELREAAREPGQAPAAEPPKVTDGVGAEPAAPVLAVVEGLTQEAVALTVTVTEVDQAIGLIDDYAREARVADEQQFARIAALEHDLASMRAQVRQEREAQRARAAHA